MFRPSTLPPTHKQTLPSRFPLNGIIWLGSADWLVGWLTLYRWLNGTKGRNGDRSAGTTRGWRWGLGKSKGSLKMKLFESTRTFFQLRKWKSIMSGFEIKLAISKLANKRPTFFFACLHQRLLLEDALEKGDVGSLLTATLLLLLAAGRWNLEASLNLDLSSYVAKARITNERTSELRSGNPEDGEGNI